MQELNKKLTEWAGLRVEYLWASEDYDGGGYFIDPPGRKSEYKYMQIWAFEHPQEKGHWFAIPEFTESLDVCFEWLVPKLQKELHYKDYYMFLLHWVGEFTLDDSDPALTLCKAIEKLIDGEKDAVIT